MYLKHAVWLWILDSHIWFSWVADVGVRSPRMLNNRTFQTNSFIESPSKSLVNPEMAKVAKHCVLLFTRGGWDAVRAYRCNKGSPVWSNSSINRSSNKLIKLISERGWMFKLKVTQSMIMPCIKYLHIWRWLYHRKKYISCTNQNWYHVTHHVGFSDVGKWFNVQIKFYCEWGNCNTDIFCYDY